MHTSGRNTHIFCTSHAALMCIAPGGFCAGKIRLYHRACRPYVVFLYPAMTGLCTEKTKKKGNNLQIGLVCVHPLL